MERGTYRRVRRHKRARPTDDEMQELVALIGSLEHPGTATKVAVIEPFTGPAFLRESIRKVLKPLAGRLVGRSQH